MDIKSLIVGQASGYPEPTGTKTITANGTGIDVKDYASADVNVPQPSGTISITSNGTTDVTNYASANVNVSTSAPTDYIEFTYDNQNKPVAAYVNSKNFSFCSINLTGKPNDSGQFNSLRTVTFNTNKIDTIWKRAFYMTPITSCNLHEGIIEIQDEAFATFNAIGPNSSIDKSLGWTSLPSTLKVIGANAFQNNKGLQLTELPSGIEELGNQAFNGCENVSLNELPRGIKNLGNQCFFNVNLSSNFRLYTGNLLSTIYMVFYNNKKIVNFTFDDSDRVNLGTYLDIGTNMFYNTQSGTTSGQKLQKIYFENFSTNPTISTTAFSGCSTLTDIYVPWSEGAVANAPWGATNATIHYDYTPTP